MEFVDFLNGCNTMIVVFQDKIETDYKLLQQTHSDCFSSSELDEAKEQLSELTIKYRELLASKTLLVGGQYSH